MKNLTLVLLVVLVLLVLPLPALAADNTALEVSQDQFWLAVATVLIFLGGVAWKLLNVEALLKSVGNAGGDLISEWEGEIQAKTGLDVNLEEQINAAILSARKEFKVTTAKEIVEKATPKLQGLFESPFFGGKVEVPTQVIETLLYWGLAKLHID